MQDQSEQSVEDWLIAWAVYVLSRNVPTITYYNCLMIANTALSGSCNFHRGIEGI